MFDTMKNSQVSFPKIGFIIAADKGQLVLSNSIVFGESKILTFPILRVRNDTGQELVTGDKILYQVEGEERPHHKSITVKKILARNLPVAPTIKRLLAKLRIAVDCEKDAAVDMQGLQGFLKIFAGVPLSFTAKEEATLIIHITDKDEGTAFCPYALRVIWRRIDAVPFWIEVPYVSDKTTTFLHRVSEPVIVDTQLRLAVLSLRILHALFHAVGYNEHIELSSLATDYEARIRGDPSLVKPVLGLQCLMSWQNLHLLASRYDPSERPSFSVDSPTCKSCETQYARSSLGLNDLEIISESIGDMRDSLSRKMESEFSGPSRYGVLYVLGKPATASSGVQVLGVLLGVSPIRSHEIITASHATSMRELEMNLLNGVGLFVPSNLLERGSVDAIEKGLKLLVEFDYDSHRDDKDFLLSSIRILGKLSEKHRIDDTSGLLHRLGVGRICLTIKVRWGSGVDKTVLQEAAEQVRRLTGWKVLIDDSATAEFDSVSSKMSAAIKELTSASGPEEFRNIIHELQDVVDTIRPRTADVVDKPVVMLFILPQFHYIPISTVGDMALGQTKSRLFSVLQMPGKYGPVHLISEVCKECQKNYTEGVNYSYSNHLSVLLIHELLHITAGLSDHRGECRLCYLDRPEMLPLRFSTCEKCIQNDGHYVHRDCLMSYACQFCIASRLDEIKDLKDILCDTCISKIRPETNYIHSYFVRINEAVYRELIAETFKKRFEEKWRLAGHH